ncbi:MAG: zinc-dependent alcohol dehydrogenase family protein [Cyclobacteriaceae bacterium]|nr:zinc-dependent alcohol dehydrogenase family protein [Cyclobacteriaceae bacterium]MCH8515924.1 zinc-dependent alcohol dehydrogenase family protein [Cyclobacteriaceae bacterium]
MKRVIFDAIGKPSEVLKLAEIDKPSPKEGHLVIQVKAANINPSDIMYIQGMYGIQPEPPAVPGFEAVGIVESAGEGCHIQVGQKVVFTNPGAWQEYALVPEKMCVPVPAEMPDEVACQALVNPMTAYAMLEESGLKSGDKLLLTAANSAFSKLVIQLAVKKGIHVYGTVRHQDQIADLEKMGAKKIYDSSVKEWRRQLIKDTEGGVQVVFEAVGSKLGAQALECLAYKGTMYVYGMLSVNPIPLNSGLMIFKSLTVKGFWLSDYMANLGSRAPEVFKAVIGGLGKGEIKVEVDQTFSLDQFADAVAHAEAPGKKAKSIFKM